MIQAIETQKSIEGIPVPPTLDSLMAAYGTDFGLCVFQSGFTRTKENMKEHRNRQWATAAISLGMVAYIYQVAHSQLYFCILDRKRGEIAMYRKSIRKGREPLFKEGLEFQVGLVMDRYF